VRKSVFCPLLALGVRSRGLAQQGARLPRWALSTSRTPSFRPRTARSSPGTSCAISAPQERGSRPEGARRTLRRTVWHGANTMSEEAKSKLAREIELKRNLPAGGHLDDAEDAIWRGTAAGSGRAGTEDDGGDRQVRGGPRLRGDPGRQHAAVRGVVRVEPIDITREIVDLYDKNSGLPAPAARPPSPPRSVDGTVISGG